MIADKTRELREEYERENPVTINGFMWWRSKSIETWLIEKLTAMTEDRDYYKRAFLLLSKTRKESDIRSAR